MHNSRLLPYSNNSDINRHFHRLGIDGFNAYHDEEVDYDWQLEVDELEYHYDKCLERDQCNSKKEYLDETIFVLLILLHFAFFAINHFRREQIKSVFGDVAQLKTRANQIQVKQMLLAEKRRAMMATGDAGVQASFDVIKQVAEEEVKHEVDDIDHEIEDALNNMIDMQIQVDMPPPVELEGLEQDDIDHIEQQKRQQEEDRLKELELARIEADLEAKLRNMEADSEAARAMQAKLGDFLDAVTGQKKGLSAIRQKDIAELRGLVDGIDEKQLVTILRIRYPGHQSANLLATELETLRNRAIQMIRKFEEILKMRAEIEKLKQATIAEIRSMGAPPQNVKDVMMATFLLLGETSKTVSDWKNVRTLLGKTGKLAARRRILELDLATLDGKYQTIKKAKTLCKDQTLAQVREVSVGAAVFFAWCLVTIDTLETTW